MSVSRHRAVIMIIGISVSLVAGHDAFRSHLSPRHISPELRAWVLVE